MVSILDTACLDCGLDKIPEGRVGMVFLVCEDRKGEFILCSDCKLRRSKEVAQLEIDRRRKLIEAEARESAKSSKKRKSSRPGGSNRQGNQH